MVGGEVENPVTLERLSELNYLMEGLTLCYNCSRQAPGIVIADHDSTRHMSAAHQHDTEGFVVPSILTGNSDAGAGASPPISTSAGSAITNSEANEIEEKDRLESDCPASSCYTKQLEPSGSTTADTQTSTNVNTSRKQKLKHKLREADKKFGGQVSGREDKIKSLTEIMGGGTQANDSGRENKIKSLREIMGGGTQANDSDASLKGSSRDWLDPHCRESEFDRQPY